jgi:hypothetical protein
MKNALRVAVAILIADAGLILVLLLCRFWSSSATAIVVEIAPLIVLAGVLTALIAFLFNMRRGRSEDVLEVASDLLAKAYEALLTQGATVTNNRHAWLSSARLVAAAEKLSKQIAEPSHQAIYEEKREYWRGRLYDLIFPSPPDGLPSSFYAEKPEHMIAWSGRVRDPLAEKSLALLYRFIQWPAERQDPIGNEPDFSDEEIQKMRTFGPRGLGNLIDQAKNLGAKGGNA